MPVSSGASSVALSSGERVVRAVPMLSGAIEVPGDKSITHRAVMFNALSDGVATVTGAGLGGDCLSTAGAMRALGAQVQRRWEHGVLTDDLRHEPGTGADVREGAVLQVRGAGGVGLTEPVDVIDAGNSGTTARLLSGVLAAQPFFSVLTGDESLRSRPMGRVITPLRMMGARIEARARGSLLPFAVAPGALRGISYSLPVASAQLKSALILAGLYADGETVIDSPEASRDHTERLLIAQGAAVTSDASGLSVRVRPTGRALRAVDVAVPGDISSAAFWLVAACIHPHARVTVGNVGVNPSRTGIVDALRAMGATIEVTNERVVGGEPVADLTASSAHLRGVGIGGAIVPRLVDELPVLAVAAAVADGTTTISDAAELRVKESDRIATVAEGLKALGVSVTERPDGMVIAGRGTVAGGEVSSHGDHRIAMAFAVAGLVATGGVIIGGAAAVDISYPAFWPTLARIAPGSVRES
jgi:3-phosphoshikimate 1-carboxyvinyltransferase